MLIIFNDNNMFIVLLSGVLSEYFIQLCLVMFDVEMRKLVIVDYGMLNFYNYLILFEDFGIKYVGFVDGYDVFELVLVLSLCKDCNDGLVFLYVIIEKGKGYVLVEVVVDKYYGVLKFNVIDGK